MKFIAKTKAEEFPETIITTHFAFFPITIGKETRWLEKVTIFSRRYTHYPRGENYFLYYEYRYKKIKFIDKETK